MTNYQESNGTSYRAETSPAVIRAIESARASGARVRVFYGDVATGRPWLEENDVTGTIGRSMGPRRVPLLIANSRSMGGGAMMDHCVVAIMTAPGRYLYRAEGFEPGNFSVADSDMPEYAARVLHNGELYARCRTLAGAERLAAFMRGDRMAK